MVKYRSRNSVKNIFLEKPRLLAGKTADTSIVAAYTDFKEHDWLELSVIKPEVTKN